MIRFSAKDENLDSLILWCKTNPTGYFLKLGSRKRAQLHRALCTAHFDNKEKLLFSVPETGCSTNADELIQWGEAKDRAVSVCSVCFPSGYESLEIRPPAVSRAAAMWPFPTPGIVPAKSKPKDKSSGVDWSKDELRASVKAYLEMRSSELAGKPYVKKQFYENLANQFGRSEKAFEYRMQNISYVLSLMGRFWIPGLKPARNVGARVATEIEELIAQEEGKKSKNVVALEIAVREESSKKNQPKPSGTLTPGVSTSEVTHHQRDARVKAWVWAQAKGICECCVRPSPFNDSDGMPYLEVHHIKQLADGGTDRPENAVALCPNCHRELHYGSNAQVLVTGLYKRVDRLVRE